MLTLSLHIRSTAILSLLPWYFPKTAFSRPSCSLILFKVNQSHLLLSCFACGGTDKNNMSKFTLLGISKYFDMCCLVNQVNTFPLKGYQFFSTTWDLYEVQVHRFRRGKKNLQTFSLLCCRGGGGREKRIVTNRATEVVTWQTKAATEEKKD